MKYLLLMLLLSFSCSSKNNNSEIYSIFLNKYPIENYLKLNAKMELSFETRNLTPIDTLFLKPLNLIDTTKKNEENAEMKSLKDYDCRLISILHFHDFDCIITCSNTINADSGYPVLMFSTFTKGKYNSRIIYNYHWQNDYTPEPSQFISINDKKEIKLELYEKHYELTDSSGIQIRKYLKTTSFIENYTIDNTGHFQKK